MALANGMNMDSSTKYDTWYEWLCHTNFSFLIGASHPHEYVQRAHEFGYGGIGITDYDGVYGIVRAWRARRDIEHEGGSSLRLFYGSEIHLQEDHDAPIPFQDTVVLMARTLAGYHNLCKIISHAHRHSKNRAMIPLETLLEADHADLVCIQPMRGVIRNATLEAAEQRLSLLKDHFGSAFYLTLSRHLSLAEDCWMERVRILARRLGCATLMSQDPYFHRTEEKPLCDLLQAIRLNRQVGDVVSHMFVNGERYLHPWPTLQRLYGNMPEFGRCMRAAHQLAESFEFRLDQLTYSYPQEMIPAGMSSLAFLKQLVWRGAAAYYGATPPTKVVDLLQRELTLIEELRFADYFLTVWDIVRWARSQGILCQGRGSAANSAICFVLQITAVDPMRFDLLFERFISAQRGDPPDIDVDFEHERREEVIQYIYTRYGRERAAMVANVITYRRRSAIRDSGKALGISSTLLNKASLLQESMTSNAESESDPDSRRKGSESRREEEGDRSLRRANEDRPTTSNAESDPLRREEGHVRRLWAQLSERLCGFPRHLGIHVGGFVLTDKSIDALVPQEPATMEGRTVIQWSKEDIEALHFFKIDILALGMLTAIRKTLALVSSCYHIDLRLDNLPQEDVDTYAMIQRGDTVGTFQIESRAQMSMLPRLRPRTFYDLVVQVGIIRPGPIQGGLVHPYLRRRNGEEPVFFAHPALRPILARTLGVPIFQEQVMRIAMAVGGFSAAEADQLRRYIGAFSINKDLNSLIARLRRGMAENGIAEPFIAQIVGHLKGFAEYGFPESHAVSFALLAYASAYLKRHYPAPFFTALLNAQPMGFYAVHTLIHTALHDGIEVLPICVNHSQWHATLEPCRKESDSSGYAIRLGLSMVRGLSRGAADRLVAARGQSGAWSDLTLFLQTTQLYRGDLTALAAAGALSPFGIERRNAIWLAAAAPFAPLLERTEDLLDGDFGQEDAWDKAERDFDATHTTLGCHPTLLMKRDYWRYAYPAAKLTAAAQILRQRAGSFIGVFGMVLVRQSPPTAKGMVFFTLEDEGGFLNLVFTPQIYAKFHEIIDHQGFLCASGRLQLQNEGHSVMVSMVYPYQEPAAQVIPILSTAADQRHDMASGMLQEIRQYH